MSAGVLVQLKIPAGLLEQIDQAAADTTRTAWLLDAARSALADSVPDDFPSSPPGPVVGAFAAGVPSPGALCMGPGCLQRDTVRYGIRRMPLCPACAAALTGTEYRKPQPVIPPAWRTARGRQATGAAS